MEKTKTSKKVLLLTQTAILTAIIFLMSFTPIGYLKVGFVEITFLVIPVAVGAIARSCSRDFSRLHVRRIKLYSVLYRKFLRRGAFGDQSCFYGAVLHRSTHTYGIFGVCNIQRNVQSNKKRQCLVRGGFIVRVCP